MFSGRRVIKWNESNINNSKRLNKIVLIYDYEKSYVRNKSLI